MAATLILTSFALGSGRVVRIDCDRFRATGDGVVFDIFDTISGIGYGTAARGNVPYVIGDILRHEGRHYDRFVVRASDTISPTA